MKYSISEWIFLVPVHIITPMVHQWPLWRNNHCNLNQIYYIYKTIRL